MKIIKLKTFPKIFAIILIIIGIVFAVLALTSQIAQQDIALAVAGLTILISGFIQLIQANNIKQEEERFQQIADTLKRIEKELEKQDQPKNTIVAIADMISSGFKCYAEHMKEKNRK